MKKKWTIATVLLLAVALLAVGTWAYFSAVGTADNVITMGSVKLALHDYYRGSVDPKTATSKLFNHVTFSKDMGNEYQNTTVHIYVTAEAVQTANLEKYAANDVRDVWKHVGTVEASTSSTQIDPIPTP